MERLLTIKQTAEAVGLSVPSIFRLRAQGLFPHPKRVGIRAVRYHESTIKRWLESRPESKGEVGGQNAA